MYAAIIVSRFISPYFFLGNGTMFYVYQNRCSVGRKARTRSKQWNIVPHADAFYRNWRNCIPMVEKSGEGKLERLNQLIKVYFPIGVFDGRFNLFHIYIFHSFLLNQMIGSLRQEPIFSAVV